jgi:hypothetical protein
MLSGDRLLATPFGQKALVRRCAKPRVRCALRADTFEESTFESPSTTSPTTVRDPFHQSMARQDAQVGPHSARFIDCALQLPATQLPRARWPQCRSIMVRLAPV